jgi:hypothetical protein
MKMWHRPRPVWSCSTLSTLKLGDFFETDTDGITEEHVCRCCGTSLFHDLEEQDPRAQHLEEEHNFGKHPCDETCSVTEQFYSHLATKHHLGVEYVKEIMEYCERRHAAAQMATP